MFMLPKNVILLLGGVIFFFLGFAINHFYFAEKSLPPGCQEDYEFINPQFRCGNYQIIAKHRYEDLRSIIIEYINSQGENGVELASVYFRDLNNGPTFSIDSNERFVPASLLKVPIMLAYFNLAENDPTILDKEILIRAEDISLGEAQVFPPEEEIGIGQEYTVDEIINRMIVNSDNKASDVLSNNLISLGHSDILAQTYRDMGLVMSFLEPELTISVRSYASIFRMLYNSSYLPHDLSEKALSYLADVKFDSGIAAGVPKNIVIANKFGERFDADAPDEVKQFHDCGIVYYPQNPYLICIMMKGSSIENLADMTAQISRMVYEEVDLRRIEQ